MNANLDHTRNFNFRILRNLRGGQKQLADELKGIASWKDLSDYYLAHRPISESTARAIEIRLNVPAGWLDRRFESYFQATGTQHEIIELAFRAAPPILEAIKTIMRHADPRSGQPAATAARLALVK